jgi:ABC-type transport system involved in multi-copper enzyme maturation permease subunit
MIRPAMIWGLARAEARLTRRLVRYWLFVVVGLLFAAFQFGQFMFIYKFFSSGSGSAATVNPHYFLANTAAGFVLAFYVGLIFLAFEVRARDVRERIVEVLDARPISNVELVAGRAVGIFLAVWVPLAVTVGLTALAGWLMSVPIHGPSIITMLIFFTIPAFVYLIGVIFLATLLVRHRFLAFLVSILFVVGSFVGFWFTPFWIVPVLDSIGNNTSLFPSDIIPEVINGAGLLQRIGYLMMGLGLIGFAIALHPRRDGGSRGLRSAVAAGLVVGGLGLCVWISLDTKANVDQQAAWAEIHRARLGTAVPDLQSIRGDVDVEPGRNLALDLELELAGTAARPTIALFAFNPGMTVTAIGSAGGALSFTHEDGLLEVQLPAPLGPGETSVLSLKAEGEPNPWFSYIDAAKNAYLEKSSEAQIVFLGYDPMIWDKRYVALMPGVRWLPAMGPEFDRGGGQNPIDYYEIDLTFELPAGWLAAGPGRRQDAGGDSQRVKYRYAPDAPLPEVCLIASRFDSLSTEIEGVTVELLLYPGHKKNIEFFADSAEEIKQALTERLAEAAEAGLDYPYGALTMVEVPIPLRGYGGGWRMDTTLTQPAMILTRENTFPTAWFEGWERWSQGAEDREGGVPRAKRQLLEAFFENDFNGGNPFTAAARSFFGYQTSGQGAEALPMDYVLEQLTSETVAEKKGFFSVHFFKGNFGQEFAQAGQAMQNPNRISDSYADVLIDRIAATNEVWDTMSRVKLSEIDPRNDPEETLYVLAVKGGAMAESMLDGMGKRQAGRFLAALRERRSGATYTREDVLLAGNDIGEDLSSWLDLWIDQTDLPGFWAEDIRYYRLTDDDTGAPRYQLLVKLRNGEAPAGLVRLEYRTTGGAEGRQRTTPITIPGNSAVEFGLVLSEPLEWLRVRPYLALNRTPFNLTIPVYDPDRLRDEEPFRGERVVEVAGGDGSFIVDDLDAGFSIEVEDEGKGLRATGTKDERDLDAGLPPIEGATVRAEWSRYVHPDAYGKYRHTTAVIRKGKGKKKAVFAAEIPRSGRWELSFHLPAEQRSGLMTKRRDRGSWMLVLDDGTGTRDIEFDAEKNDSGWNSLGVFDVASGTVRLIVSNETDGSYVLADAIRWTPKKSAGEQVANAQ